MAKRVFLRPAFSIQRLLLSSNNCTSRINKSRHYLSASYRCDDSWNKRLHNPLINKINLTDYYHDLDRKYKMEGKISAIDVDLFLNRIDEPKGEGVVEEVEEVVRRLRRSPETVHTLESTHYAVVRTLLDGGHTGPLLQLLTQPLTYGLFPDHLTCNLLMSTFLNQKEYAAAARVASYLMLQEDFGPQLTQCLALASCYQYVTLEHSQPWEDYTPEKVQPKEEVKIRVKYLRNPYFDDHFDLKEGDHLVGKTLAWLSPLIGGVAGRSCELLGWTLYNKWNQVQDLIDRLTQAKEPVATCVMSLVKSKIEGMEDAQVRDRLLSGLSSLECCEEDLSETITDMVQQAVKEAEPVDIKAQEENFSSWEKQREEEYQRQIEEYKKKKLMVEIENKKKDLAAREEVIYFFDNKEKLFMLLPEKKISKSQDNKSKMMDDENYIPPEV